MCSKYCAKNQALENEECYACKKKFVDSSRDGENCIVPSVKHPAHACFNVKHCGLVFCDDCFVYIRNQVLESQQSRRKRSKRRLYQPEAIQVAKFPKLNMKYLN